MSEVKCEICRFPVKQEDIEPGAGKNICGECKKLDEIESLILKGLNEYFSDEYQSQQDSPKEWTKSIKNIIGEIGEERGYGVCTSGEKFESGWLYDMVWYKNKEAGYIESIPLVLESELSNYDLPGIKHDFEKLLLANAERRIMICCAKNKDIIEDHFRAFLKEIKIYKLTGQDDRFMIIIYNDEDGWFYTRLLTKADE